MYILHISKKLKNSKYIYFFSGISLQTTDFPLTNFDAGPCLILVNVNLRFSDEVCECAGNDNYVKSHLVAKIFRHVPSTENMKNVCLKTILYFTFENNSITFSTLFTFLPDCFNGGIFHLVTISQVA